MDRVNKILNNEKYKDYLKKNNFYEKNREFCKHDMEHFLAVARISYILCLEKGLNVNKDIIYAVGLLHDIGRWLQYEKNIQHKISSVNISEEILKEVIKYLITGFFSFEVIIKLHFSIIKKGKKVIMNIDFFTKAN